MRALVCLFILIIILSESTSIRKYVQNVKKLVQRSAPATKQNHSKLIHIYPNKTSPSSNTSTTFAKSSVPKLCLKKKTRYLKKERIKLRKMLKKKTTLENKIRTSKSMGKLRKINAHLKRCRMKSKQSEERSTIEKETNNRLEVTTISNVKKSNWTENSVDKILTKQDEDLKAQSDDYTIIESHRLDSMISSSNFSGINDLLNEHLMPQTSIHSHKHNQDDIKNTLSLEPTKEKSVAVEEDKYDPNIVDEDIVDNKINYADLMKVKTTTLPPLKNISLNRILDEFNAIHNEIQEIIPHPMTSHKIELTNQKIKGDSFNRCNTKKGGCHHKCHPFGIKQCSCMTGFKLINRKKCLDVNECLLNNGGCETFCHNTPGSYYCSCRKGFRLSDNQQTCIDINECLLRNGHGPCQDTCVNTPGSYECSCSELNGTKLSDDRHSCEDINECLENKAGCSHQCVNTLGRAYCICPEGMALGADWKTCLDVNECEEDEVNKHCKYGCINTIGSFRCANNYELQNDQVVPDLVVCPKLYPPNLGFLECTRKRSLSIKLRSKSGRRRITNRPGTFCELACPDGYKIEGMFKITCGYDGEWFGEDSGICKKE